MLSSLLYSVSAVGVIASGPALIMCVTRLVNQTVLSLSVFSYNSVPCVYFNSHAVSWEEERFIEL